MLLAEYPPAELHSRTGSPQVVGLRLHGGTEDESLIPLDAGKHSVGSGPRCDVRIQQPGVQPLHCVIAFGSSGMRVRRWAEDTLLNGVPFDEAPLAPGDRLTMGSVELEVVGDFAGGHTYRDVVAPSVKTPRPDAVAIELETPEQVAEEKRHLAQDAQEHRSDRQPPADTTARTRSRKLVAALRRHRDQYDELVDRVSGLEQRIEAMLSDRALPAIGVAGLPSLAIADESTVMDEATGSGLADDQDENSADDWLISARAALSRDRAPWNELPLAPAEEPIDPTELDNFDAEVMELRAQLAASDARAAEAQASLTALEHQLADSRRMLQLFAEERTTWQSQLSDTEARLNDYIERIQELAIQLEQARDVQVEAPVAVAATVEAAAEQPVAVIADEPTVDEPTEFVADEMAESTALLPQYEKQQEESWSAESAAEIANDEPAEIEAIAAEPAADESSWEIVEAAESLDDSPAIETAVETVAETVADTADDSAPEEVNTALSHLRELSIWRQQPVEEEEETPAAECPEATSSAMETMPALDADMPAESTSEAVADESRPAESTAPESFIDRYSHLFDDEQAESTGESDSSAASAADDHVVPTESEPAFAPVQASAPVGEPEDEESIEQYMAKLLERMRGVQEEGPSTAATSSARSSTSKQVEQVDNDSTEAAYQEPEEPVKAPRPRMPAAELSTDMDMLRALANQSARHAIGVHTARSFRRKSFTRLITALLACATAFYFLLEARSWDSFEFGIACIAALVTVAWGRLTYVSLVKAAQVGAFDDVDESFVAIDGSKLPLPIDGTGKQD